MRCFIALSLPEEARESLEKAATFLRARLPGLAWAAPPSYHITLAFLGEIDGKAIDVARRSLRAAASEAAFPFSFSSLDSFPPRGRMSVLVARIDPEENCSRLHKLIDEGIAAELREAVLGRLGENWPDRRRFSAHVTVARVGRAGRTPDKNEIEAAKVEFSAWNARIATIQDRRPWIIDRCVLYKSELRPTGAKYSELESQCLA